MIEKGKSRFHILLKPPLSTFLKDEAVHLFVRSFALGFSGRKWPAGICCLSGSMCCRRCHYRRRIRLDCNSCGCSCICRLSSWVCSTFGCSNTLKQTSRTTQNIVQHQSILLQIINLYTVFINDECRISNKNPNLHHN
uniref:Uncharacterized protein n=1 Tax=Ditylenchus dipsaci TaxID=166011 RepID=A0A915DP95_9BILA